jgi:hypothetical protein
MDATADMRRRLAVGTRHAQEMIGLHETDAKRLADQHGHTIRIAYAGTDALAFDDLRPDRITLSVGVDGAVVDAWAG